MWCPWHMFEPNIFTSFKNAKILFTCHGAKTVISWLSGILQLIADCVILWLYRESVDPWLSLPWADKSFFILTSPLKQKRTVGCCLLAYHKVFFCLYCLSPFWIHPGVLGWLATFLLVYSTLKYPHFTTCEPLVYKRNFRHTCILNQNLCMYYLFIEWKKQPDWLKLIQLYSTWYFLNWLLQPLRSGCTCTWWKCVIFTLTGSSA